MAATSEALGIDDAKRRRYQLLIEAEILTEDGEYHSKWFSQETIERDKQHRKNNMKSEIDFEKFEYSLLDTSKLTEDHIVAIGVDTGTLPAHKAVEYLQTIKVAVTDVFYPAKVLIHQKNYQFKVKNKGEIEDDITNPTN